MKNRDGIVLLVVAVLIMLLTVTTNTYAYQEPVIMDDAGLLTEAEKELLYQDMLPITQYGGVAFVTNAAQYTKTASEYAAEVCRSLFHYDSGTVFLIDMYNRRIEIFSTGAIEKVIGTNRANGIADNIYTYASREKYYECAKNCFEQMLIVLEGGKIAVPMRYVTNLLFAAGIVLMIMGTALFYDRKMDKLGSKVATVDELGKSSAVKISKIVMTKQTKTVHTSSSSSGGGGGGGGYSGGGGGSGGGHGF